ncbi:Pre-mRNA splicing factor-domain-containing protein [Collybia nuda]|uniref:Pre-mRNA splicing factor-domain-containing protein n=1 Tax=Collybia nuda TaxID=64659 RepID=A0A9P5XYH3_9AGAR|nr:Pre-mRNA splicing factor-domain-containing protein [Collybia nuda]
MGGGDLNMKKSWHPLLLKNQERVWLEEKKALEEKKKLDQLRKEKEEERQLQELQRLQEEQTGKKRTEKLEWMYSTPATGASQNPNDLEDYLLGKKRVDKILTADENAKIGAAHKNFIAVQNANNARDIAAKIREDPLLAIKQQEQAAYEALMSNPLRLREMQERNGIKPKKNKEERRREKELQKKLKQERKHRRSRQSHSPEGRQLEYQRSPSYDNYNHSHRFQSPYDHRSRSRSPLRRRSRDNMRELPFEGPSQKRPPQDRSFEYHRHKNTVVNTRSKIDPRSTLRPRSEETDSYPNSDHPRGQGDGKRSRSASPYFKTSPRSKRLRISRSPPQIRPTSTAKPLNHTNMHNNDREARLAVMSTNASSMSAERQERLAAMLEKEKAELAAEEQARAKSKGMGGFLSKEQKKVFSGSGGLEERIRRGRGGMVVDED